MCFKFNVSGSPSIIISLPVPKGPETKGNLGVLETTPFTYIGWILRLANGQIASRAAYVFSTGLSAAQSSGCYFLSDS